MSWLKKFFTGLVVIALFVIGSIIASQKISAHNETVRVEQAIAKQAAIKAESQKRLDKLVSSFAKPYGDYVGVVVTDLSNGASASAYQNEKFVSASLYKLFVAYDVYRQVDNGKLWPSKIITVTDPDDGTSSTNTISGCLNLMITISDNDCGDTLGSLDSWRALDKLLNKQGYTETMLNNYYSDGSLNGDKQTSAHDVALLLTRLYDGTLLSRSSTSAFIDLLKAQTINDRLPTGLPAGTVIAHKTGDLYGYLHDAGIIYGPKKNVLVVLLTGDWDEPQTQGIPLFTALASSIWSYMQS